MSKVLEGSGILYVNSRIVDKKLLPESLFHEWYSGEHIPDVLKTGGAQAAFRYEKAEVDNSAADRPYLAVYFIPRADFLGSKEFDDIPVVSDQLPGESKNIFDLAEFDVRFYNYISKKEGSQLENGPTGFLRTMQFNAPSEVAGDPKGRLLDWYTSQNWGHAAERIRLFEMFYNTMNKLAQEDNPLSQPAKFLALEEYATIDQLKAANSDTQGVIFTITKEFGDRGMNF